jgi:phosphatidylserine/phosphatidylglycerophosphate/cardiolipin synthase-like enzyme
VDASEAAVQAGQTCPASLSSMLKRGVQVFSREGLHAKVFVFGTTAYIGSANVSGNSEK